MNNKPSNIFRLRIKNIKYEVDNDFVSVKTICTIKYINPITHHVQKSKGVAKCPIDEYNSVIGKRISEGRAKAAMYSRYAQFVDKISDEVILKHSRLAMCEFHHVDEIIQYDIVDSSDEDAYDDL
jgi:hypothetical protein